MRLLDLYCGEGGAALGYHQAGFEVTGVDHDPKKRRYYPYRFIAANAIGYALAHGHEYDAIHASPPCQRYSHGTKAHDTSKYPDLVAPTRKVLDQIGKPWIIENVVGAPLHNPTLLCGTMFTLATIDERNDDERAVVLHLLRHRLFESNIPLRAPRRCVHRKVQYAGVYHGGRHDRDEARYVRKGGYVPSTKAIQENLMGLTWHGTVVGLAQAIPPAYTAWLGQIVAEHLATVRR